MLDSEQTNPGQATANHFDTLSLHQNHGGKIIMYHGLADGLISPKALLAYHNTAIPSMNISS